MKHFLIDKWSRFSRRERLLCMAAGCVLVLYGAYTLVFEGLMQDILNKQERLTQLNTEYQALQRGSEHQKNLKKKLSALKLELKNKKVEGGGLAQVGQLLPVETLLGELRKTAGEMSLQLVALDMTNGVVFGTDKFSEHFVSKAKVSGSSEIAGQAEPERAKYAVSKIVLSYRSEYRDSVNYFLKVMDMPYGVSVKTVEMTRGNRGGTVMGDRKGKGNEGGISSGRIPLDTKLELEIFSGRV